MPDNQSKKARTTDGMTLFFDISMMGLLFAIVCFIFCQIGIKIGEGRTADMEKIIEEQNEKITHLEEMVQNVDNNVTGVKNNIKSVKNKIEILSAGASENEDGKKDAGGTDDKVTGNGAGEDDAQQMNE